MEKMRKENRKRKYLAVAAVVLSVYLFMKYLSPIFSPFLLAFFLAGILSRLADKIPMKVRKSFLASVLLVLLVSILVIAIWVFGSRLLKWCGMFTENLPFYEKELCRLLHDCCGRIEARFKVDGEVIEDYVLKQVTVFAENIEVKVVPVIMNKSVGYMKAIGSLMGFLAATVIGVFLMLKDYEKIEGILKENGEFSPVREVGYKVFCYIKTYLKAQAVILLTISIVCVLVLTCLGIKGSLFYGILTGIMDLLPFIGTGIMLLPLALWKLLEGKYWQMAVIFMLYGVCALLREFLEPKLIGNKIGIWPVAILFSVFAGIRLFGVAGVIKGPLGLVIIWETCRYLFEKDKT